MNKVRMAASSAQGWQQTSPYPMPLQTAPAQDLPPLTEVLRGLDSRELCCDSLFDQLFGDLSSRSTPPR